MRLLLSLAAVSLLLTSPVRADDARPRPESAQKQAADLAARVLKEQAARLIDHMRDVLARADDRGPGPGDGTPRVRDLKQHLDQLRAKEGQMRRDRASEPALAEMRERIAQAERQLREAGGGGPGPDDLRARAKDLFRKADDLAQHGGNEEAERLRAEGRELEARANTLGNRGPDQGTGDRGPGRAQARLQQLKEEINAQREKERRMRADGAPEPALAGVRDHIGRLERELHDLEQRVVPPPGRGGVYDGKGPRVMMDLSGRARHLRVAADNLRAAGAHELAGQLTEKAEALEREARQQAERRPEGGRPGDGALANEVRELRREIERLRAEVQELRQQLRRP